MIIQIPCDMLAMSLTRSTKDISSLTEYDCTELVKQYLSPILKYKPNAVYLNVCYRRSAVPSEVFSTFANDIEIDCNGLPILDAQGVSVKHSIDYPADISWVSPYHKILLTAFSILLRKGIDLCGIAMQIIKKAGVPLYLSVRASDNHGWPGMGTEFLDQNSLPNNGRPDYSQLCVQTYFLNYIEELLRNYDPDGIEIDWLRAMPVVPDEKLTDYSIINDYMCRVRKVISFFGKKLTVRVFATIEKNLANGMDVCRWIADGSIDSFTAENFYIPTNFEIPIGQWRQEIAKVNVNDNPYELYCGSDWAVSCGLPFSHYMTPALIRGFVTSCMERGADDVYLFNLVDVSSETTVMLDEQTNALTDCVEARFAAVADPNNDTRRYVYLSGCDKRYPLAIPAGESKTVTIYTGNPGMEYRIYICSKDNNPYKVLLNGKSMSALQDEPVIPGFEKLAEGEELPVRYSRAQFDNFVRFAAAQCHNDIQSGYNTFTRSNTGLSNTTISWIEVEVR